MYNVFPLTYVLPIKSRSFLLNENVREPIVISDREKGSGYTFYINQQIYAKAIFLN